MNVEKLIELVANKLAALGQAKATAEQLGQIEELVQIETEIVATETMLAKLKTLI